MNVPTISMPRRQLRGSTAIKVLTVDEYTGGRGLDDELHKIDPLTDIGDGFRARRLLGGVLYRDDKVYTLDEDYNTRKERTHPDVVAIVEELGERASGDCAKLAIVEIPDGVEWEIDEYDGMEHIAEAHRTWR